MSPSISFEHNSKTHRSAGVVKDGRVTDLDTRCVPKIGFSHLGVSSISANHSQLPEIGLGVAKTEVTRVRKEARYVNFMMKDNGRGGDRPKAVQWVSSSKPRHRLLYVAMDDLEQSQIFRTQRVE